jgi:hypothetical protein
MARIAGINIPPHKHAEIGLTSIYGIGRPTAQKICSAVGIPFSKKIKDLTDADLEKIRDEIGRMTIEGDLRRELSIRWTWDAIGGFAIVVACPFVASARAPMPAPARARARVLPR